MSAESFCMNKCSNNDFLDESSAIRPKGSTRPKNLGTRKRQKRLQAPRSDFNIRSSNHSITPIIDEERFTNSNTLPGLEDHQITRARLLNTLLDFFPASFVALSILGNSSIKASPADMSWLISLQTIRGNYAIDLSLVGLIVLSQTVVVPEYSFGCNVAVATSQSCFRIARDPPSFIKRMVELPDNVACVLYAASMKNKLIATRVSRNYRLPESGLSRESTYSI